MAATVVPAGVYPVGYVPTESVEPITQCGIFLADKIDPATGEYLSIASGVDPVDAAAIEALRVRFRSGSAVRDDGNRLHERDQSVDATETLLASEVAWAWRRLIAERHIELLSVSAVVENDGATLHVRYRNLATGAEEPLRVPL